MTTSAAKFCVIALGLTLLVLVPGVGVAEIRASGEGSSAEVIVIDVKQAKRLHDLGATFIDVRNHEQWRLGHIENARHVSFSQNFASLKTLEGVSKNTPLVFYCSSPECEIGAYAAAVSMEWGFENVLYFQEGYFAWMLEDYPINLTSGFTTVTGTIQIRKAPAAAQK